MAKILKSRVLMTDRETGNVIDLPAGSVLPKELEGRVTNPSAFVDDGAEDEPVGIASGEGDLDLSRMKKPALIAEAGTLGVEIGSKDTAPQIRAKIQAHLDAITA